MLKKIFTFSIAILLTYISAYGFKKYWYRNENKIFTINDKKKTIYVKSSDYYMSILIHVDDIESVWSYLSSIFLIQRFFRDFNKKTLFILDLSNLNPGVENDVINVNAYYYKNMLNIAFIRDKSIRMRLTNKIGIMNQSGVFMQNPDKILSGDWTALYDAGILHHIFPSLKPSEV